MEAKRKSFELQKKLIQRINSVNNRLKREPGENRAIKYLINSKAKEKQIYERLFSIYNSEVSHFLYE